MWSYPFELLIGDYLSMPTKKGGYRTVGLYLDTFSQHIWGYKFKTASTGKTTVKSLEDIYCYDFEQCVISSLYSHLVLSKI
jgi:hypothetical protein